MKVKIHKFLSTLDMISLIRTQLEVRMKFKIRHIKLLFKEMATVLKTKSLPTIDLEAILSEQHLTSPTLKAIDLSKSKTSNTAKTT